MFVINRSSAFQDRQMRNLFRRHYKQRSYFKEAMMRCEVERIQTLRKKKKLKEKLDELERRKAFLQGRRENLLSVSSHGRKRRREDDHTSTTTFRTTKIRRIEAAPPSIFKGSGFLDSGNFIVYFSTFLCVTFTIYFLNHIGSYLTYERGIYVAIFEINVDQFEG